MASNQRNALLHNSRGKSPKVKVIHRLCRLWRRQGRTLLCCSYSCCWFVTVFPSLLIYHYDPLLWFITVLYHSTLSLWTITALYHYEVPLHPLTISYHYELSLSSCVTMNYHCVLSLEDSLWSAIAAYHCGLSLSHRRGCHCSLSLFRHGGLLPWSTSLTWLHDLSLCLSLGSSTIIGCFPCHLMHLFLCVLVSVSHLLRTLVTRSECHPTWCELNYIFRNTIPQ